MTGRQFGRWRVVAFEGGKDPRWLCACTCGTTRSVLGAPLRRGGSTSCGCCAREATSARARHGHRRGDAVSRVYRCWQSMIQRSTNPKNKDFHHYGGRGITVCERWHSFQNFLADMGEPPPGLTLDRRDNDGNYEPRNCRWATQSEQIRNQRHGPLSAATIAKIKATKRIRWLATAVVFEGLFGR
jgi:hypothetical protein